MLALQSGMHPGPAIMLPDKATIGTADLSLGFTPTFGGGLATPGALSGASKSASFPAPGIECRRRPSHCP